MLGDWEGMLRMAREHVAIAEAITWKWSGGFGLALQAQALTRLGRSTEALAALRALHAGVKDAGWPSHYTAFVLEASRWLAAFAPDEAGRREGREWLQVLATTDIVDSWVGERARKVVEPGGTAPAAQGEPRDWMVKVEALLPRATMEG